MSNPGTRDESWGGSGTGRLGRVKRSVFGSRTVRLPPPPSVGSALSRGCAGSAARGTKHCRGRRHNRAGPGPWPGHPLAPRLRSRRCCHRPRPCREVFEHHYVPGTGIPTKNLCPPRAGKNDPDAETEAQRGLKLAQDHIAWTLQS